MKRLTIFLLGLMVLSAGACTRSELVGGGLGAAGGAALGGGKGAAIGGAAGAGAGYLYDRAAR